MNERGINEEGKGGFLVSGFFEENSLFPIYPDELANHYSRAESVEEPSSTTKSELCMMISHQPTVIPRIATFYSLSSDCSSPPGVNVSTGNPLLFL